MRLRHTSIRQRMLLLVLVPLTALVLVYGYAVAGQVSTARGLANAGQISGTTITPVTDALTALNAERTGAVLYLASRSPRALAAFQAEAAAANHEFRLVKSITKSGPVTANATPLDKEDAARFVADGDAPLQALRGEVASGSIGRTAAINAYSAIMAAGLRVAEQSLQETFVSQSLASTARQEVNLYTAEMLALQENDIYSGDVMAGQLPAADQKEFAQLASLRQFLVADATPQLDSEASTLLRREVPASLSTALTGEENAIIAAPAGSVAKPPVALKQWQATAGGYGSRMAVVLTRSPAWIQSQVKSSARRALTTLIVAAGLGLLLVLASVLFSLLMGRRLMRRLNGLREAALELAHERLPQVMARLRDGETVEVDTEAPAVEGGVDEIDQVHQAFNTVHRAAVAAAVDETNLRRGINQVFRNLARRSQVLLHRQLGVLDGMERRAEEPDQLEDLFRIDHLTTRMRRHAEGLIVLAGDTSGRGWRQPVRFVDVLRAAVAEVEDYTRVRVEVHSKAALAGPAVADVVHLLAELIENAAVYSPPTTVVRVQGEVVGRGFCVEVEDRGLGMPEDQLAEINDKLASVPAFDLAGSDRLGLFVAGRLAHRHDISVALRTSVYGGTTAVVIIPTKLVIHDEAQVPAVTPTRYALRHEAQVPALTTSGGHALNGHALNGSPGNGHQVTTHSPDGHSSRTHLSNGHSPGGHRSNGHAPSGYASNGHGPGASGHRSHGRGTDSDDSQGGLGESALADSALAESVLTDGGASTDPLGLPAVDGAQARPAAVTPPPVSGDPGWWAAPTRAAEQAVQSVQAAQAPGSAEVVADAPARPAPVIGEDGLPVRVRQASLAPQLRDRNGPASGVPEASPASAESVRSTMSAMQRGWERGRSVAAGSAEEPARHDPGSATRRSHPEEA
jgi:signal transduction histidine kinase